MKKFLHEFPVTCRKLFFLLMFFGIGVYSVNAQKQISGKVVDEGGVPIIGASVIVKGTSTGTATDFDGLYKVDASPSSALVFSSIGFITKEVTVGNQETIDVTLIEDISKLDEVVIIGYGQQKRTNISGAVSVIESEEMERNPTANLSNALVGQTAGVIAVQRSGAPGDDESQIFIRGVSTDSDSSPIYVIDGIPRSSRAFAQLNANEIESLSVLKDAASAAVFGVRGGNGVILVTTKRGKSGKMQINVSSSLGIQERTRDPELLGSYEWAQLYNEALVNEGQQPLYTQDDLDKYRTGSSPDTHPDTDWLSVLDKTPMIRRYGISANGGSDNVQFATSFGYLEQEGIVPSNEHKRFNLRSNIDAKVTETTKLSFDLSARDENTNNVEEPELFRWLISARPNLAPIRWSNGGYSSGPAYLAVPENGYRNRTIQNFTGRIQIEQQLPLDGLSIKAIASYFKSYQNHKNFKFAKIPFYTRSGDGTFVEQPSGVRELYQDHGENQSLTLETHLNYNQTFGKTAVSALMLYTQTEDKGSFLQGYRDGYTLAIDELAFGSVENRNNWGSSSEGGRQGIVGRLNLTFDEKYIIEGSFRADGSEQFASGNRWGFFPSGSLAYLISKEPFLEKSSVIDFLKLRGSYGVLGNDRIGGRSFLYLQSFNQSGNAVFGDGSVQPAIVEGPLPNLDVTWETVKKLNVGFDLNMWNSLISLSFDYFYDKRSDILGSRTLSVPSLLGIGLPVENLKKIDNKGFEVSLGHKNTLSNGLTYAINSNFTFARNKVLFQDEPESENPNIRRTGRPLGAQYGYVDLGLFQTQEEIDNAPTQGDIAPGDIRYADINGDGVINDLDITYIGSSNTPEIIFGLNGNVQYKGFEVSFLLQGATNVNQGYGGEAAWPFFLGTSGAYVHNLDRWTPTNRDASEPRVLINNAGNNHAGSSFWLRDASYVRLKNVELAYNIPVQKFGDSSFIKGIRVYANGNNLHTWTKLDNYDPENGDGRGWGYPQLRIWNFGIDFNF
ncbi:SusC/RagA family TonB-linked outer membrane protein [Tamlana flava]|uniref:SusC/RagA family TonB-linked outer membrane protein n=1 Tax=Tamlana flava TaxID=3158572 RepID=UPI00351AC05E